MKLQCHLENEQIEVYEEGEAQNVLDRGPKRLLLRNTLKGIGSTLMLEEYSTPTSLNTIHGLKVESTGRNEGEVAPSVGFLL